MTSPIAEAIECYSDAAKDLLHKWRRYVSQVNTNLDSPPYTADTAASDFGTGVSLAIQTGARLWVAAADAMGTLLGDYSDEIHFLDRSTQYKGAKLDWLEDLENGFREKVPREKTKIIPSKLGLEQKDFRVRVDTTGCRAGVYVGTVRASSPDGEEPVPVRVDVP